MTSKQHRLALSFSVIALGTALVTGCSSTDSDATSSPTSASTEAMAHEQHGAGAHSSAANSGAFNSADVDFATMMYPHHAQAVDMAKMVAGKDAGAEVTALAREIEQAQAPEMDAFTRLLGEWGKPAPSAEGHSGHAMAGMMTDEQMRTLQTLRGAEFDREWLTMMIEHHRGAIEMADTELSKGVNAESRTIAESIKTSQQAEIDRMQKLLK